MSEAGISEICLTWQTDWLLDLESWAGSPTAAMARLDDLLATDILADNRYLNFRAPSRDVVVFDDCNDAAKDRLAPFAFLIVQTSPGNYHVWLRFDRPEFAMAVQATMEPTGANIYSFNGGRLPGFINRKGNRREADGSYPLTTLLASNPGRIASTVAMVAAGLISDARLSAPTGPRTPVRHDSLIGSGMSALSSRATSRSLLISRWSTVSGRAFDLPFDSISRSVTAATLEIQLDLMARWRRIVPLHAAVAGSVGPGSAVLGFDRPTAGFKSAVLPILEGRRLPATLFVNMDRLPPYRACQPLGRWDESHEFLRLGLTDILALRERGVELGVAIGTAYWTNTLGEIRGQLERGLRLFGPAPVPLTFWHDHYHPEAHDLARKMGYYAILRGGLSGLNPPTAGPHDLRAAHAGDWHHRDPAAFAGTASGVRHLFWKMRGRAEPMP